ncbi:MAG TPA: TonB family protein [Pyrinomonadaceae bacterium]|jgi:TonB family protein
MRFTRINLAPSFVSLLNACVCLLLFGAGGTPHAQLHAQATPPTASSSGVNLPTDTARGIELYKAANYREAIEVLRGAVKERREDGEAWLHLGIALSRADENKEARKAFEKAIKLKPDAPQAHIGMAYLLLESGKPKEAERAATHALTLNARNAEAHYALGLIHLRQNAPAKALAEADATLQLNPTFAGALLLKVEAAKEAYAAAYSEHFEKLKKLKTVPEVSTEERAAVNNLLKEASAALDRYLALFPGAPNATRLREEAETLRFYSQPLNKSGEPFAYPVNALTTKAQITSKPEPLYTEQARHGGISGTVRLRMVLAFDGKVRHILVVQGLGGGLSEMAVEAARKIKFTPATRDGRPVSQFVTIEYNFHIR